MLNKLVKPFGVSVEVAFRRVDMIAILMKFFPPPHSCMGLERANRVKTATKIKPKKRHTPVTLNHV